MWTTYPPRYHDATWTPTAEQWCAAWGVPVAGGNATVWIATYGGQTYSRPAFVPADEGDVVLDAIGFAPSPYVRSGGTYSAVWREVSVPVSSLQPISRVPNAYILSGCTVGGAVTPPTGPPYDVDRMFAATRAWSSAA